MSTVGTAISPLASPEATMSAAALGVPMRALAVEVDVGGGGSGAAAGMGVVAGAPAGAGRGTSSSGAGGGGPAFGPRRSLDRAKEKRELSLAERQSAAAANAAKGEGLGGRR